jgi:hypothetical protein
MRCLPRLLPPAFALAVLAAVGSAAPVGRMNAGSGDTVLGTIVKPGGFGELVLSAPRGARFGVLLGKAGPGSCKPVGGFLDGNYVPVPAAGRSPSNFTTAPVTESGVYRLIVTGSNGTVGHFRVKATVKPQKTFALKGKAPKEAGDLPPSRSLVFGAIAGATFTVQVKWKGATPVTLDVVTDPDGVPLTSDLPAKHRKRATTLPGYTAARMGDYRVRVSVPDGTKSYTVTVKLAGKLPPSVDRDNRVQSPTADSVELVPAGSLPLVKIVGERGGPNDFGLAAVGTQPSAVFADRRAGQCLRATTEATAEPSTYELRCTNGYSAEVENAVVVDGTLPGFDVPRIRSPLGTGSATLSELVFDAAGLPVSWTEVRTYHATGTTHSLRFSAAERYTNFDAGRVIPLRDNQRGRLGPDEAIVASTTFVDLASAPGFDRANIVAGDVLRFTSVPALLLDDDSQAVVLNVRDVRITSVTDRMTVELEEPLIAETPPAGGHFEYRIVRPTSLLRQYSVEHTDERGVIRTYHDAGGRVR